MELVKSVTDRRAKRTNFRFVIDNDRIEIKDEDAGDPAHQGDQSRRIAAAS
jgi:hypothetical protein